MLAQIILAADSGLDKEHTRTSSTCVTLLLAWGWLCVLQDRLCCGDVSGFLNCSGLHWKNMPDSASALRYSCSSGRIGSEMSVFTVCKQHESDNSKAIGTTDCIDDVCTQTQSNFLRTGAPQLNTESTLPILIKSARFKCEIGSNSCQFVQKDFQRSFREDSCWKGVHQKLTTLRK